jgi:hypothetical protein
VCRSYDSDVPVVSLIFASGTSLLICHIVLSIQHLDPLDEFELTEICMQNLVFHLDYLDIRPEKSASFPTNDRDDQRITLG